MKVLHIIPSVASVRGGPSQAVIEMVTALRNLDVDAEIATTNDNGDCKLEVPVNCRVEYKQIPTYFFSSFPSRVLPRYGIPYKFIPWLLKHGNKYDLIHIHGIFSCLSSLTMAICRIKKIPYIVRPLGQLCTWSMMQGAAKKRFYFNLIEKKNIDSSIAIHLTSKQEQQELSPLNFQTNNFILPHGLAVPSAINNSQQKLKEHFEIPADEKVILFMSRLHEKKGLDYLIPALSALKERKFTFIIAGIGEQSYKAKVEHLLIENGLKERTIFTGFVNGELKNLLLQGADLFALTSHSENFGIVVLEALAAGLPVVITPGVALSALVEKHNLGRVCELEIDSIVKAIEQLIGHSQEPEDIEQRARKLITEEYSWESNAKKLVEIYHQPQYSIL